MQAAGILAILMSKALKKAQTTDVSLSSRVGKCAAVVKRVRHLGKHVEASGWSDEFEGRLRVATTDRAPENTNNLFVLEQVGDELQMVGSLTDIAEGERIFSSERVLRMLLGEMLEEASPIPASRW